MDNGIRKRGTSIVLVRNGNVNPNPVDYIDGCFDPKIAKLQQQIKKLHAEKKAALNNFVLGQMQDSLWSTNE